MIQFLWDLTVVIAAVFVLGFIGGFVCRFLKRLTDDLFGGGGPPFAL